MKFFALIFAIFLFLGSGRVFAQPIPVKWYYWTSGDGVKIPIYSLQVIYEINMSSPKVDSMLVNFTLPDSVVNTLRDWCLKYDHYAFTNYHQCYLFYPNYKIVRKVYDPNTGTYSYPETWGSSFKVRVIQYENYVPKTYSILLNTTSINENETFWVVLYFYTPYIIPAREIYYAQSSPSCSTSPDSPWCVYYKTTDIIYSTLNSPYDTEVGRNAGASILYLTLRKSLFLNLSNISDYSSFVVSNAVGTIGSTGITVIYEFYSPSDGSIKRIGFRYGAAPASGQIPPNVTIIDAGNRFADILSAAKSAGIDLNKYYILRYMYVAFNWQGNDIWVRFIVSKLPN